MKRVVVFVVVLLSAFLVMSQEVIVKRGDYPNNGFLGLYNNRTNQWIVQASFKGAERIGVYDGVTYFTLQQNDNELWGVVSSADYSKWKITPQFNSITFGYSFSSVPILCVQKNADWGLLEVYSNECYYLFPCKYQTIINYSSWMLVRDWNGNEYKYYLADMKKMFDDKFVAIKEQKEREAKQKADQLALEKKERELASFTEYAKQYVTPLVNKWQQKGEFEKLTDYQERVTGSNRERKINELTLEAERKFIDEHALLDPTADITLGGYDSENEVFQLSSSKFGKLLLSVPISEGQTFKDNFKDVKKQNPVYFIKDDKIALKQLEFFCPASGKVYTFNNQAALNYQQYELDADLLGIDAVRIKTSYSTTAQTNTEKPTCTILTPSPNSTYSTSTIKLSYLPKVANGLRYDARIRVNGEQVEPIVAEGQMKGAQMAKGVTVEIPMPQEVGKDVTIQVQIVDETDSWAEPKFVKVRYVGEAMKPSLHIFAVGVGKYNAKGLADLSYAAKDAKDFVETIKSSDLSQYKDTETRLLLNDEVSAPDLRRELVALSNRVSQGDVVMLYFSGHGVRQGDDYFFMTPEIEADDYFNALDFKFIKDRMRIMSESKQCRVIIFMDACHSGGMQGMKGSVKDFSFATPSVVGFYSSTSVEQSAEQDKLRNGVFTKALLDGIKGAAAVDGAVTLNSLEHYVKTTVSKQTNNMQNAMVENQIGNAVLFKIKK